MNHSILKVQNLSIHYGGVKAVDDVTFNLEGGQIRALIGPNGAGKSTIIDAISGRRPPTSGKVILDGIDITSTSILERRRQGLSRSFQRTSIFTEMKVRDQVELAAHQLGDSDYERNSQQVMGELNLLKVDSWRACELAYGEQRRLDLALALVGRPRVLLLDEPMAGLSVPESRDLAMHLSNLARQWDVSVLLVEHDMEVVFSISQEVTVLEQGRILAEGNPQSVRNHPRVREAYLGSAA